MTFNDPGHVNNLDKSQIESLKNCWISLTDKISKENNISIDEIIGSPEGDQLFRSIGYDNPDVLILRWLRARKFDVNAAVEQLMDTFKWRRESKIDQLLANGENELILEEILTGKTYFMGRDRLGRPINYIHVKDHIKDQYPTQATEKLGLFSVEIGRKLLDGSVETGTVVIDMIDFGMNNMDYQLVKFFLNLLENYYPESLGLALIVHAPFLFQSCWTIIRRWLDPIVESKIHFIKHLDELNQFIDPSNIPKRLNGIHEDFKYIPPTEQDKIMLSAFRHDKQGRKLARSNQRKVARHYLDLTLKWAHGDNTNTLLNQRKEATKQLRDAFEQLVPYINTQTYYHRIGDIHEPIFHILYQKIQTENDSKIVQF